KLGLNLLGDFLEISACGSTAGAGRAVAQLARPATRRDRRLSPGVLKSIRRKLGVTHRVLDVLVAKPSLQRPCVVKPQPCRSMCGGIGNCILARAPIRPNSAWKALGVIGPSRSVIKTCEDSPCSRCRRRSARISSPCIGWTLGEPFFVLRTCSRPVASLTCDHRRSHNSDARKPWRPPLHLLVAAP